MIQTENILKIKNIQIKHFCAFCYKTFILIEKTVHLYNLKGLKFYTKCEQHEFNFQEYSPVKKWSKYYDITKVTNKFYINLLN